MSNTLFEPQEGQQNENTPSNQEGAAPKAQEPNPSQTPNPTNLFADQLAGIKDEDGRQKYADVNTALNSLGHAQSHITNLEDQVAQLQEELNKRQGMEQVMERIEAGKQTNTEQPSVNSLSKADVLEIMQEGKAADIANANEVAVSEALADKFGDKAREQLELKASELGVNVEFLQGIARKSPQAILSYFDAKPSTNPNPTTNGLNTEALNANVKQEVDEVAAAKAKLFGQTSPLKEKWRAAAPKTN